MDVFRAPRIWGEGRGVAGDRRGVVGVHEVLKKYNSMVLYNNVKNYDMTKTFQIGHFPEVDRFVYKLHVGWIKNV